MITPEAFEHTHARHVTDVIRVSLERRGIIGFIDIHGTMNLVEARAQILENVENAPADFQFMLDDGVPVSARQENSQKISYFYPCVKIRECKRSKSVLASPMKSTTGSLGVEFGSVGCSEKVSVYSASGEEFTVWISDDYTFQQLRRDAARYWNVPPAQVALTDAEGCLWPEQARILSLMSIEELNEKKIVLENKAGPTASDTRTTKALARTASTNRISARSQSMSSLSSFRRVLTKVESDTSAITPMGLSKAEMGSSTATALNPVQELWHIFTFYCVNGDSLELECIRAHQFNRLLRDSQVFVGSLTPAMVDIIYTSETKGKPKASGKMSYNEFLNALMKIARTRQKQSSKHLCDSLDEELLFQKLVLDNILPRASRWPVHRWEQHTQQLRQPEIVLFVSKFVDPLLEIFMFYAKAHLVNAASGVKEFYMSYADYQRFVNDFCFANLQVSSVEAAQVCLASCSSPPFHDRSLADEGRSLTAEDLSAAELQEVASSLVSVTSGSASIARVMESAEGIVSYALPEMQVGRICMGFSAFLDMLGRTGLVAFSKTKSIKTIHCLKAVFHHLSRGLTRSRVLEILRNHGTTSMHATKFYSGTVSFNNRFLDMWRYEGSPDYLTGNMLSCTSPTIKDGALSGSTSSLIGGTMNGSARRAMSGSGSSPSIFDDRSGVSGAGRGREALDRLVRTALYQNSADMSPASIMGSDSAASCTMELECDALALNEPSHATSSAELVSQVPGASETTLQASLDENDTLSSSHIAVAPCAPASLQHIDTSSAVESHELVRPAPLQSMPLASKPTALGLVPRREDEERVYQNILLKGGVFKKYGQWGNPHRRYVWCSKEFDALYWRPLNKKHNMTKEGIPVASMLAVLPGNSTRTRYAFMKHLSDGMALIAVYVLRSFCDGDVRSDYACRQVHLPVLLRGGGRPASRPGSRLGSHARSLDASLLVSHEARATQDADRLDPIPQYNRELERSDVYSHALSNTEKRTEELNTSLAWPA